MKPYKQSIQGNKILREFAHDTDSHELVWHRDKKDRIVRVIEGKDWKFQFDNQLPININGEIFVPSGVWHRLIKGTSPLQLKITKLF